MRNLISLLVIILFLIGATMGSSAYTGVADMKVTASGYYSGSSASYSSTTKNKGPDTATGVVVSGGISGGSIFSVSTSQGTCTISGDSFTCNVGTLAANDVVYVSMSGSPPNFGSHPNDITYCGGHYTVTADQSDPNTANNGTGVCVVVPGGNCGNPAGCGTQCQPGFFWCAASGSCVPVSGHCP